MILECDVALAVHGWVDGQHVAELYGRACRPAPTHPPTRSSRGNMRETGIPVLVPCGPHTTLFLEERAILEVMEAR